MDLTGKVAFIAGKLGFSICVKVGFLSFISYTSYSYIPFSNSSGHFFSKGGFISELALPRLQLAVPGVKVVQTETWALQSTYS